MGNAADSGALHAALVCCTMDSEVDLNNDLRLLGGHLDSLPQVSSLAGDLDTLLQVLLLHRFSRVQQHCKHRASKNGQYAQHPHTSATQSEGERMRVSKRGKNRSHTSDEVEIEMYMAVLRWVL